jgi:hypothetical protein
MSEYNARIRRLERERQRIIRELLQRPFGDRVFSDTLESELQEIERSLLDNPPLIVEADGEPVFMGRGLKEDEDPGDVEGLVSLSAMGVNVIPQDKWPGYIAGQNDEQQLHVEPFIKTILNQGSVGSCASEGGTGCVMAKRAQSGQQHVTLNPYFVYHVTSGGSDQGSTLSDTVNFLRTRGCASAEVWPRSHGWRATPSNKASEDALKYRQLKAVQLRNWDEFGTMLLHGEPVYFGYTGHAIFGSRLIAPNRFRYCNSWGEEWGDKGFGTISNSSIEWSYGVYAFLSVTEAEV